MFRLATASFVPDDTWESIVRSLRLSPREAEIVALLPSEDSRDDVIAERLGISRHTVHTYIERLYRKVGATSRSQVVTRIFQQYVVLSPRDSQTAARSAPAGESAR